MSEACKVGPLPLPLLVSEVELVAEVLLREADVDGYGEGGSVEQVAPNHLHIGSPRHPLILKRKRLLGVFKEGKARGLNNLAFGRISTQM